MKLLTKFLLWGLASLFGLFVLAVVAVTLAYWVMAPGLPDVQALKDVRLQVPLRVFSHEGLLMAEYGEKRRIPVLIKEVPEPMIQAFLAAEDDRFYEHPGVDYQGVLRAVINLVLTGKKSQGASTITMQVAKNFFLSPEKTYTRKIREMFLAFKIEKELTKDEILELYLNKIYLGHRSYGVGAAAQVYYGATIQELTLPQIAMIAGLPKAPSGFNPIVNPERAFLRRNYVLGRMHDLGFISDGQYDQAKEAPLTAMLHRPEVAVPAPYVGEMVRAEMFAKYGEKAYTEGFNVRTTIRARLQRAADRSLKSGLLQYDVRHGYRGPIGKVDLNIQKEELDWDKILKDLTRVASLRPALITKVNKQSAEAYLGDGLRVEIPWQGLVWARKYMSENYRGPELKKASDVLSSGDLVYVRQELVKIDDAEKKTGNKKEKAPEEEQIWVLSQMPEVSGALVSIRPVDGAILALTGGFDFYQSKFNRVIQAERQPGSSFKPFIYSAALKKDYTPASIINDAPVVFEDSALEDTWRPENYSGKFYGPTRLRVALTKSRNLVSIRLLRAIGIGYALRHAGRFGFDTKKLPSDLSLALGSGTVTPLELARGYSVFANGGYLVSPYFIEVVEGPDGAILDQASPQVACETPCKAEEVKEYQLELLAIEEPKQVEKTVQNHDVATIDDQGAVEEKTTLDDTRMPATRAIAADNAFQIASMMRDVIRHGTGRKAMALGRNDLSGKTGTTNDQKDAWFSGYNADIVTTVWVGFDRLKPLGSRETGAGAALPLWVSFMAEALRGMPEHQLEQPPDMVTVRIDPETGLLAGPNTTSPIFETFRESLVPTEVSFGSQTPSSTTGSGAGQEMPEQLF
jgi:penicillin-binding protein 1A